MKAGPPTLTKYPVSESLSSSANRENPFWPPPQYVLLLYPRSPSKAPARQVRNKVQGAHCCDKLNDGRCWFRGFCLVRGTSRGVRGFGAWFALQDQ